MSKPVKPECKVCYEEYNLDTRKPVTFSCGPTQGHYVKLSDHHNQPCHLLVPNSQRLYPINPICWIIAPP